MLSISKIASAGATIKYLEEEALLNYYDESGAALTRWAGKGAKFFGLDGPIEREELRNLLQGHSPDGVHDLVQNAGDKNRQPGHDLVFNDVKDFSTLWGSSDAAMRKELDICDAQALDQTLSIAEELCGLSRVGRGGRHLERVDLIFAAYRHQINRYGEPHIHTHVILPNVGIRSDNSTGALWTQTLYDLKFFLGALHRVELASRLRQGLKVHIEAQRIGFRIVGVPQALSKRWSSRATEIREVMAQRGQEGAIAARAAAEDTRRKKPEIPLHILSDKWRAQALEYGFTAEEARKLIGQAPTVKATLHLLQKELWRAWKKSQATNENSLHFYREAGRLAILHGANAIQLREMVERLWSRPVERPTKTAEADDSKDSKQETRKAKEERAAERISETPPPNIPPQVKDKPNEKQNPKANDYPKEAQRPDPQQNLPTSEAKNEGKVAAEGALDVSQVKAEAQEKVQEKAGKPRPGATESPQTEPKERDNVAAQTAKVESNERAEAGRQDRKLEKEDAPSDRTKTSHGPGEPSSPVARESKSDQGKTQHTAPRDSHEFNSDSPSSKESHSKENDEITGQCERIQKEQVSDETKTSDGPGAKDSLANREKKNQHEGSQHSSPGQNHERTTGSSHTEQSQNTSSNSEDQKPSSEKEENKNRNRKSDHRSFRRQWQEKLRAHGIDLDEQIPKADKQQRAANAAFCKEFTEAVSKLRPEWQSAERLQRLAYLSMMSHRAHPKFVDQVVAEVQHIVEKTYKSAQVAEEKAKLYASIGMDRDGKAPWTQAEKRAANRAFAKEYIETIRSLPPQWQTRDFLQHLGYELMLKHRPQTSLVDRAVAGCQEAVKKGHDQAVRAEEWAEVLREIGPEPKDRMPFSAADQKAADKAFRKAFRDLVEKIPRESQTPEKIEALARAVVVEHRLHPRFLDRALENIVPLANPPLIRIESRRLFPKSPIKALRDRHYLRLVVGSNRSKWGRIYWKQNLLIGELRIQSERLFPNAAKFLHIRDFAIPRFRFVPLFPTEKQRQLAAAATGWKPAFMHKSKSEDSINSAYDKAKDEPETEKLLPRLRLVTKEPNSLPKETRQETETTEQTYSKLHDQGQTIAHGY